MIKRALAIYGDLGWISLENRIKEKKLVFAGRVAEEKGLPWMSKIIALTEEVGLEGASKFTIRPKHMENGSEVSSNGKG